MVIRVSDRDRRAFALRKAGKSPVAIAKELGFKAVPKSKTLPARSAAEMVEAAVGRALAEDAPVTEAFTWQDLERARLGDLLETLRARLDAGENVARDMLKVHELIERHSSSGVGVGDVRRAVDETVAALDVRAEDHALVALLRANASAIDRCLAMGTAEDERRALNMAATMRNILTDLGATPAARETLLGRRPKRVDEEGAEKHERHDIDAELQTILNWEPSGGVIEP